jgi:hypothetical protein
MKLIHKFYGGKICVMLAVAGTLTACSGGGGGGSIPKTETTFTDLTPDTSPETATILETLDTEALAVLLGVC